MKVHVQKKHTHTHTPTERKSLELIFQPFAFFEDVVHYGVVDNHKSIQMKKCFEEYNELASCQCNVMNQDFKLPHE